MIIRSMVVITSPDHQQPDSMGLFIGSRKCCADAAVKIYWYRA